jgi:hypothetical protein
MRHLPAGVPQPIKVHIYGKGSCGRMIRQPALLAAQFRKCQSWTAEFRRPSVRCAKRRAAISLSADSQCDVYQPAGFHPPLPEI